MAKEKSTKVVSVVPREFVTQPFFPAKQQTAPRVLDIKGVKWTIGVPRPDKRGNPVAFDMRHGRLCFALLSFYERLQEGRVIRFSMNELAHRMASSNGGRYSRKLLELLFDLRDTWVRVENVDGKAHTFSIIGEIATVEDHPIRRRVAVDALTSQPEFWLDRVTLNPDFFGLLQQIANQAALRLDVLIGMTSDIAQSIYTYLPSRAVHRSAADPFEITLSTLMGQIGLDVPEHKSVRKKLFTQRTPSIIDQLNGAEVMTGTLRVELAETVDGTDFKLRAWVDQAASALAGPPTAGSTLLSAWRESGRSKAEFDRLVRRSPRLTDHHVYLIEKAGAQLAGNEMFFRMAAALLGGRFDTILAETKGDAIEGRQRLFDPTRILIWRLMEAIKKSPR
jgi:hypothetical protein